MARGLSCKAAAISCHRLSRELGEEFQLDGGEQRLRRKETQADLHDM
jgi:hypothetical protein